MEKEVNYDLLDDLPDRIPEKLLGKFPHFNKGAAHPVGLINTWESTEYWNIPEQYRDRVCYGYRRPESSTHKGYTNRGGIPVCAVCGKPPIHALFYCVNCGDLFIKDFADTRFCPLYPHCYGCLPSLSWSYCPDHTIKLYVQLYSLRDNPTIIEPIGLNPRKFTDEEIADALNDDSLWEL